MHELLHKNIIGGGFTHDQLRSTVDAVGTVATVGRNAISDQIGKICCARIIRFVMVLCVASACLQGEEALVVNPQIFEIKYCREAGGGLSMWPVLQLTVRNPGTTSIILARFTRLSAFSLFADQKDIELNRPETGEISSPWRMFDASKLNKAEPAPELFEVIKPHASCELGMQEIRIPLKPGRPALRLMGRDHYLRLAFNPWPESRRSGEELRRAWASYGRLQIESLVSPPIKLHIDADPPAKPCIERID